MSSYTPKENVEIEIKSWFNAHRWTSYQHRCSNCHYFACSPPYTHQK